MVQTHRGRQTAPMQAATSREIIIGFAVTLLGILAIAGMALLL